MHAFPWPPRRHSRPARQSDFCCRIQCGRNICQQNGMRTLSQVLINKHFNFQVQPQCPLCRDALLTRSMRPPAARPRCLRNAQALQKCNAALLRARLHMCTNACMHASAHTLMVASSEPEYTWRLDATSARTAPLWPEHVPLHSKLCTSHARTDLSYEPLNIMPPHATNVRTGPVWPRSTCMRTQARVGDRIRLRVHACVGVRGSASSSMSRAALLGLPTCTLHLRTHAHRCLLSFTIHTLERAAQVCRSPAHEL